MSQKKLPPKKVAKKSKKNKYKAFDNKFVLSTEIGGSLEISCWTDKRKKRIPVFFNTKADAVLEIADNIKSIAEAVKQKDYTEDHLDDIYDEVIANAQLDVTGHLFVYRESEDNIKEVIYNDNIDKLDE